MNNQELAALCRIEIRRWQAVPDKQYMVDLLELALAALTAEPVKVPVSSTDWVFIRFTDVSKNQRMKCKIEWTDGYNSVIYDEEGAPLLLSNNAFEVLRLNAIDNTAQQYEALDKEAGNDQAGAV